MRGISVNFFVVVYFCKKRVHFCIKLKIFLIAALQTRKHVSLIELCFPWPECCHKNNLRSYRLIMKGRYSEMSRCRNVRPSSCLFLQWCLLEEVFLFWVLLAGRVVP